MCHFLSPLLQGCVRQQHLDLFSDYSVASGMMPETAVVFAAGRGNLAEPLFAQVNCRVNWA